MKFFSLFFRRKKIEENPGVSKKRTSKTTQRKSSKEKKLSKVAKISKPKLTKALKEPPKKKKASHLKEELIGEIVHYFPQVSAGVIKLRKGSIKLGDTIHIKGHTTDFIQEVTSLQINNVSVKKAEKPKVVGFLSKQRVRRNDKVFKVK